jgi:F-type H+-transporting ATPase subunit b
MLEGLKELGFNPPVLLAQIINFGILFVLLYLVAFRPITRMLDKRAAKIKEGLDQSEHIKEQAAQAEAEYRNRIEEAGKAGQDLINRATKTAEEVRAQGQQKALEEAQALLTRARNEIQRERDEALGSLRREFADLTIAAAEKVIERSLDKQAHREIIDKVLAEAPKINQG